MEPMGRFENVRGKAQPFTHTCANAQREDRYARRYRITLVSGTLSGGLGEGVGDYT